MSDLDIPSLFISGSGPAQLSGPVNYSQISSFL